ncbi:ribonuclease P protein component [Boudabousia tangfeifanii]|uniref:Ribonuclease P protein component n=1 Tax=Boudabousia tangfeifanii TaxID=1912795 RepID=A0A1D9MM57_9ACTO|nr:ribonuclease P protein component [Boudabousia tangfeifanii]AOZ73387.1 ribonuclease P protein component [Boudabousia tangfeifanii]
MLPRAHRMVSPADFTATFRRGARVATPRLVLHVRADKGPQNGALVGFVVPKKAVKLATGRNLVKRRLREIMSQHLAEIPANYRVVLRANAAAATATYQELVQDVAENLPRGIARAQALALKHAQEEA